jgi:hypothetical protein
MISCIVQVVMAESHEEEFGSVNTETIPRHNQSEYDIFHVAIDLAGTEAMPNKNK